MVRWLGKKTCENFGEFTEWKQEENHAVNDNMALPDTLKKEHIFTDPFESGGHQNCIEQKYKKLLTINENHFLYTITILWICLQRYEPALLHEETKSLGAARRNGKM